MKPTTILFVCPLLMLAISSQGADINVIIPWQGGTTFTTNINVYDTTLGYSKSLRVTPETCYHFKMMPTRTSDRLTVVDGTVNRCEANYTMTLTSTNLQGWITVSGEIELSNECGGTCGGGGGSPTDQDFTVTVTQRVAWAYYTLPTNGTNLTCCAGSTNTVEVKVLLGDAGIPGAGTVSFSASPTTLGTFSSPSVALSASGRASTEFLASTNGMSGTITANATGLQDEAGKTVPNVSTNLSLLVVDLTTTGWQKMDEAFLGFAGPAHPYVDFVHPENPNINLPPWNAPGCVVTWGFERILGIRDLDASNIWWAINTNVQFWRFQGTNSNIHAVVFDVFRADSYPSGYYANPTTNEVILRGMKCDCN